VVSCRLGEFSVISDMSHKGVYDMEKSSGLRFRVFPVPVCMDVLLILA